MIRLFLTLYVLVLVVAFGFLLAINPALKMSLSGLSAQASYRFFGGTTYLLDQALSQADNTETFIQHLNDGFAYNIQLLPSDQTTLTAHELSQLQHYQAAIQSIDNVDYVYINSTVIPDKTWRLQTDPSPQDLAHDVAIRTALLIQQQLHTHSPQQWPEHIQQLQNHFGFPIGLINEQDPRISAINAQQQQWLNNGKVIGFNEGELEDHFLFRIQHSDKLLIAGPVSAPYIFSVLLPLVFVLLASIFGIAIYLWVFPLWKYLNALKRSCNEFGQGDFSVRAPTGKLSHVNNIAETFNSMASRVQSLISSHKELTNGVSHELRTPLSSMRFSLEMLSSSSSQHDRQRFINEISTDIEELDALISELLTYARFERAQPDISRSPTPVISWLSQQVQRAQKLSQEVVVMSFVNNIPINAQLVFESRLISRALSNLLQNAIKYADKEVHLHTELQGSTLLFTIDDDGPGIPSEKYDDIFSPFSRVDESRDKQTGGFGIGLAIVKQVADWHKGSIGVDVSPLGGARFCLSIPNTDA